MRAPQESPALRKASMYSSSFGTMPAFAAKNGLSATCSQDSNGIGISPSWLMQPLKLVPYYSLNHFLAGAAAPAAGAGGRAGGRPPPRGARGPGGGRGGE